MAVRAMPIDRSWILHLELQPDFQSCSLLGLDFLLIVRHLGLFDFNGVVFNFCYFISLIKKIQVKSIGERLTILPPMVWTLESCRALPAAVGHRSTMVPAHLA